MEQRNTYGALVAAARVTSGAAFSGAVYGFTTVASLGAGLFELTLANPIDDADSIAVVTVDGLTSGSATVQRPDDDTILVDTFSAAAAAANRAFQIAVFRHGIGTGDRP